MKNARFLTGLFLLTSPLTGIIIASCGQLLNPELSVEGRVMYRGVPVRGGTISFTSQDRERSGDMVGYTDQDGYFSCRPKWWNDRHDRTRFRICVTPDPRAPLSGVAPISSEPRALADQTVETHPASGSDWGQSPGVVLASMGSPAPTFPAEFAQWGERRADLAPRPPLLEVSLGSESVHIDIDLKD